MRVWKTWKTTPMLLLVLGLVVSACNLQAAVPDRVEPIQVQQAEETSVPTETIPPSTPLPTLTPSQTLRPPPTFEPPTPTRAPTETPTVTPTTTLSFDISIPGLRGAETPTPTSTEGCVPRREWELRYTVQRNDALAKIADRYGTTVAELMEANCLTDANYIVIDQQIRVPGEAHPQQPAVECIGWEVLTPINGTVAIPGEGQMTFNWRGPRAPRNLIRVIAPDGSVHEWVVELRQNETIDLADLPLGGEYRWYVFPLDWNFVQVSCLEGGPWIFVKQAKPPTPTPGVGGLP